MIEFNFFHDEQYRTARLHGWAIKIHLDETGVEALRDILESSGFHMDNHICFSTEVCNFWYSDGYLYVGGEIVEERY